MAFVVRFVSSMNNHHLTSCGIAIVIILWSGASPVSTVKNAESNPLTLSNIMVDGVFKYFGNTDKLSVFLCNDRGNGVAYFRVRQNNGI